MRAAEWRAIMAEIVGDVESRLCASAPRKAHKALDEFRERVKSAKNAQERRQLDEELDALLERTPYFRGAYRRHKRAQCERALMMIKEAVELVKALRAQIALSEAQHCS